MSYVKIQLSPINPFMKGSHWKMALLVVLYTTSEPLKMCSKVNLILATNFKISRVLASQEPSIKWKTGLIFQQMSMECSTWHNCDLRYRTKGFYNAMHAFKHCGSSVYQCWPGAIIIHDSLLAKMSLVQSIWRFPFAVLQWKSTVAMATDVVLQRFSYKYGLPIPRPLKINFLSKGTL